MKPELKKLYIMHVTPKEGAFITGMSPEIIRKYIKKGFIETITLNGRYYIHVNALTEFAYFYAKKLNINVNDMETIEDRIKFVLSGLYR